MKIFIEIISALWQVVTGILGAIATTIWNNLPEIMKLKQIMGYFTPTGIIALWLGVPTVIVSVAIFTLKKILKDVGVKN